MSGAMLSRRALLAVGGAVVSGLAGCSGDGDSVPGWPSESTTEVEPVAASVEGRHLVVRMPRGSEVSKVTLVDPAGRHFGTKTVQTGVRQVRFELLDPRLWGADYVHYDPGVYELVVTDADEVHTIEIPLVPDVRIVDVRQVRDDELPRQYVGLVVTVENRGTGPTWIHDIAYQDSPFKRADSPLLDNIGNPIFSHPNRDSWDILEPLDIAEYVNSSDPLRFEGLSTCGARAYEMTVKVGVASGDVIQTSIRLTVGGEPVGEGFFDYWKCDSVDAEVM